MSTPHPDPDVVADYLEDLLPREQEAAVGAHLAECADCAALRDQLSRVSHVLAAAAEAAPAMPESVYQRVTQALSSEPLATRRSPDAAGAHRPTGPATTSLPTPPATPSTAPDDQPARARHRRRPSPLRRLLPVAASLVVLVGGGYVVAQELTGAGTGSAGGSAVRGQAKSGGGRSTPELAGGSFDRAVRDAVRQGRHQSISRPSDNGPRGVAGGSSGCVRQAVSAAGAGAPVVATTPARWHGTPVVLAVTDSSAAAPRRVHGYAVAGCPAKGRVVHDQEVQLRR